MRITNSMIVNDYIRNLNKNYDEMAILHSRLSSGKNILKSSDDPVGARKAMEIRSSMLRVAQYTENVVEAKEWLNQTETSLNEMNSLLARIYELAVKAASESNGPNERGAIADEIEQLTDQLVVSANTNFGSKYIFGGMNTTSKPFVVQEVDGENVLFYNGHNLNELELPGNEDDYLRLESQRVNFEIGYGIKMDISFNGTDIIGTGENNLYAVMNKLLDALQAGDGDVISECVKSVQERQDGVISLIGELGGKTNRLDLFAKRLGNDDYNYSLMLEDTEGIDVAQVLLAFRTKEMIYQAALAAGSKIIVPTLADFI